MSAERAADGTERAADGDGAAIEQQVIAALDRLGVPYEIHRIDPAYADTAAYCAHYGSSIDRAGNTIVVASKKEPRRYAACVVRGSRRLDVNHAVKRLLEVSKVSFATAEETRALTGMLIGGVTVFALPPDLPIYVDDQLMGLDRIVLGSGSRSSKILVSPEVFRRLPGATIVPGLSGEAAADRGEAAADRGEAAADRGAPPLAGGSS
jgi:prolyl-tRNA editing enzyme YbaK/EbsC (Cys-tRNA(Pro) deacylase)